MLHDLTALQAGHDLGLTGNFHSPSTKISAHPRKRTAWVGAATFLCAAALVATVSLTGRQPSQDKSRDLPAEESLENLAIALAKHNRLTQAESLVRRTIQLARLAGAQNRLANHIKFLADILLAQKKFAESANICREGLRELEVYQLQELPLPRRFETRQEIRV